MVPKAWLNEGGQSVAGAAIELLLAMHPASADAERHARESGQSLPLILAALAARSSGNLSNALKLADGLHIVPEFLGNRTPFADPHARDHRLALHGDRFRQSGRPISRRRMQHRLRSAEGNRSAGGGGRRADRADDDRGGVGTLDPVRQLLADATGKPTFATQAEEHVRPPACSTTFARR
jgi:D-ribulokinase